MSSSLTGRTCGGMPEWSNGLVSKTKRSVRNTGVRIPLPPLIGARSSIGKNVGFRIRKLGVRVPSGAPMTKKKPVKREFSAGGVVFKKEKKKTLWLIIQPEIKDEPRRQKRWQLPKGWIDEGETGSQAALREVKEEGGVEAEIIEKIGRINIFFYDQEKQKVLKNIVFFLMKYQKGSIRNHSWETKEAIWLPFQAASKRLTFDSEKKILKKAKELLEEKEKQPKLI